MNKSQIAGAIGAAYAWDCNVHKTLDTDLAKAIIDEIAKIIDPKCLNKPETARIVRVYENVKGENYKKDYKWERVLKGYATFHQFGCDCEEFESGPGNFTTAIIEYDNGKIDNVAVTMVEFIIEGMEI